MNQLDSFFDLLKETPEGDFFNPWFQRDEQHDIAEHAPAIRRNQLKTYLQERLDRAQYLFIAEALGYQGGHFTGIAMTSERILLGHHETAHGIPAEGVFRAVAPSRTSKPAVKAKGMTEPTATIMWKALHTLGLDPYEAVLWNALPWHPFNREEGLLSNRTPTDVELRQGHAPLKAFLKLFPDTTVIAVGRKCEQSLQACDIAYTPVRHPANGGAPKFRRQMKALMINSEL